MLTPFGRLVRMMRVASDRTLKLDADELGVRTSALSGWENGRESPPESAIRKLAEIYAGEVMPDPLPAEACRVCAGTGWNHGAAQRSGPGFRTIKCDFCDFWLRPANPNSTPQTGHNAGPASDNAGQTSGEGPSGGDR